MVILTIDSLWVDGNRFVAKVGVVDKGHNVTSFNDEPINGLIADLADGDA